MWEHEKWTYVLDAEKVGAGTLNMLMIFVRLANAEFDKMQKAAGNNLFAASRYFMEFYDSMENDGKYNILVNKEHRLCLNGGGGYKSGGVYLERRISPRRAKSAMVAMRDRSENVLYKDFESLFLKT